MRRIIALALAAAALGAGISGCGGSDDDLEARVAALERQVTELQADVDRLEADTRVIREVRDEVESVRGIVDGLAERLADLGDLADILEQIPLP